MLGFLESPDYPIDGLTGKETNPDSNGNPVLVQPLAAYQGQADPVPANTYPAVSQQILGSAGTTASMSGFVLNYVAQKPKLDHSNIVMYGFAPEKLPVLTTLAKEFAVCDHWFSSVPGPTLPNRLFAAYGSSFGEVNNLTLSAAAGRQSIFERLVSAGRAAKIYYYDSASSSFMIPLLQRDPQLFATFDDFLADTRAGKLPDYSFIEPNYNTHLAAATETMIANDDHPDHNVQEGELFIAQVYNAIHDNPELWRDSVLLITFSNHGGFYDHVVPPTAVSPDGKIDSSTGFDFQRLGVRVPTVIVSPYIAKGTIDDNVYDHTSIPATVTQLFLGPQSKNSFSKREQNANTFLRVLTLTRPRADDDVPLLSPR
jgi:phospholipase C